LRVTVEGFRQSEHSTYSDSHPEHSCKVAMLFERMILQCDHARLFVQTAQVAFELRRNSVEAVTTGFNRSLLMIRMLTLLAKWAVAVILLAAVLEEATNGTVSDPRCMNVR
jgi:hypothetical protein